MAETSRGRQMVFMATRPRYHVVKLLELDEIKVIKDEDISPSDNMNLKIVQYSGKAYHAVEFGSGDYVDMALTKDRLVDYERKLAQFRGLGLSSKSVQTESSQSKSPGHKSQYVQTDMDAVLEEQSPERTYSKLRSAMESLIGPEDFQSPQFDWANTEPIDEIYQDEHDSNRQSEITTQQPLILPTSDHEERDDDSNEKSAEKDGNADNRTEDSTEVQSAGPTGETKLEKKPSSGEKTYCILCNTFQSQLPRHVVRAHGHEDRVKRFANLPPKDPKRLAQLKKLRLEGYIAAKRSFGPARVGSKADYLTCSECNVRYSKNNFYRHYRKCSGRRAPKNVVNIMETISKLKEKTTEQSSFVNIMSEPMKKLIIPKITDDADRSIMNTITADRDLVDFGNSLCLRFGPDIEKQQNLVRHKLRTVTRFKLEMMKKDNSIKEMTDIFHEDRWSLFLDTVKEFAKLEEKRIEKKSPNNVKHLGLLLSNFAKDLEVTCKNEETVKCIQRWLKLFERKYSSTIGWQGNKLSMQKKWKAKKFIPLAEDIIKLNSFLKNTIRQSKEKLKSGFDYGAWCQLSKSVMTQILCFNRKRVGEVMNVTLEDYNRKDKVQEGTDAWKSLSQSEKTISSKYFHMLIRGKFARPVPILIDNEGAESIGIMIQYRDEAGVDKENPFLFAKRGDQKSHYDANVVLRDFSKACGAERPEDLRSRGLRTHIATVSQALNLSDNDLKVLCSFLGHTTLTHIEHYRMPSDVEHTARLSKLLTSLDNGTVHNYRGKTIDEIDYDNEISIEMEEDEPCIPEPQPGTSSSAGPVIPPVQKTPKKRAVTKRTTTPSPAKSRIIKKQSPAKSRIITTPSPAKSSPRKPARRKWIPQEIKIMKIEFECNLKDKTLPSYNDCNRVKMKYSEILRGRKASQMKAWINNQNKKRRDTDSDTDSE